MVKIVGPPASAIRNRPINEKLARVLERAAEAAGIEMLQITSGGQPGTTGGRVGSHRHDDGNAADLKLIKSGRALSFINPDERPVVEAFVTAAAANGATGIGAGVGYMGPQTLHVGFGTAVVWGAGGKSANAPNWLREAFEKGRNNPKNESGGEASNDAPESPISAEGGSGRYVVIARDGARLRGGPGNEFDVFKTLATGTELAIVGFDDANKKWALIDLEGDQLVDGYVLSSLLASMDIDEGKEEDHVGANAVSTN